MTLSDAERLVQAYGGAMAQGTVEGTRRDPSLLPDTSEQVLLAIKIFIAFLVQNQQPYQTNIFPLINVGSFIDTFQVTQMSLTEFSRAVQRRQIELEDFHTKVLQYDTTYDLYWSRVYAELGLPYEDHKVSILHGLKSAFRRAQKRLTMRRE